MDINSLEYFLQLAKSEHMSQTADFFNIAQSSLSKSISNLEGELGVKLFDRIGKRIKLNRNGMQFAKYTEESLNILRAGVVTTKDFSKESNGHITIACYAYFGIIQPLIIKYSKLNPLIYFELESARDLLDSKSNEKDFIIYSSREDMPSKTKEQFWVSVPLFKEKDVLIISPELINIPEGQDSIDLTSVKDIPFIITSRNDEVFFSDITYKACHSAGFYPKKYMDIMNLVEKAKFVEAGLATALIPECCVADAKLIAPKLRCLQIKNYDSERTISVMRKKKHMMSEAALDFWKFLLGYFKISDNNKE